MGRIVAASPGPALLDVGCGTGTAARQFRAAGCTVLGVEPDERMADFARRSGIEVEVARFEDWRPEGRSYDAVVAGTAWHWVDPVVGAAKAAQVLHPGGLLAPFHHVFEAPPEVGSALADALTRVAPDAPFLSAQQSSAAIAAYQPLFDQIADGIREAGGFGEPDQWQVDWDRRYTRAEWLDQLPTLGALNTLSAEALAQVQDEVGTAIDALGGEFTTHYATVAVTAVRSPRLPRPQGPGRPLR